MYTRLSRVAKFVLQLVSEVSSFFKDEEICCAETPQIWLRARFYSESRALVLGEQFALLVDIHTPGITISYMIETFRNTLSYVRVHFCKGFTMCVTLPSSSWWQFRHRFSLRPFFTPEHRGKAIVFARFTCLENIDGSKPRKLAFATRN